MNNDFTLSRSAEGVTATPVQPSGGHMTSAQIEAIKTRTSVESIREGLAAERRSPTQVGKEIAPGVVVSQNETREVTDDTLVRVDGVEVTIGDLKAYSPGKLRGFDMPGAGPDNEAREATPETTPEAPVADHVDLGSEADSVLMSLHHRVGGVQVAAAAMETLDRGLSEQTAVELGRAMGGVPGWKVEARILGAMEDGRRALASRLANDGLNIDDASKLDPSANARFQSGVQQMIQTRGRLGYNKIRAALSGRR